MIENEENEKKVFEMTLKGLLANMETSDHVPYLTEAKRILDTVIPEVQEIGLNFKIVKDKFYPLNYIKSKHEPFTDSQNPPIVKTLELQRYASVVKPWLLSGHPFIMVGPEGCGK